MKKLLLIAVVFIATTMSSLADVTVGFSTKARWDAQVKDCAEAKGVCIHISFGALVVPSATEFNGKMVYDASKGLVFKFSKSQDMTRTIFSTYFSNNSFYVAGDSPVDAEALLKAGYPSTSSKGFTISQGRYPYSIDGDIITVVIPVK
ncbi:MAG: hypothetical protein H0U27_04705 [Nitrosopumilus sp.]|nr:hypothetical protein [Nitrosopumilus sp.]